jgi:hypothetical protein
MPPLRVFKAAKNFLENVAVFKVLHNNSDEGKRKRVNLSLCFKHYAMNTYEGVDV